MNLQKWLRDGDPVVLEGTLDRLEAGRMRDRLLAAARSAPAASARGPRLAWQAALVAGCASLLVVLGRNAPDRLAPPPARTDAQVAVESVGAPRQLHFSTPGGTRVIWLFDPEFEERR